MYYVDTYFLQPYTMNNSRNSYGFKDCSNCFLEGGKWTQWTDQAGQTKEDAIRVLEQIRTDKPADQFKIKKIGGKEGFYRIYILNREYI